VVRPRTLLALLDVEAHGLATAQAVEVERGVDATLVEEVLLTIVGGDEPKSAVGNDFLYGAFWHSRSPPLEHRMERIGPVRERRMPAAREVARRPSYRAVLYHTGQVRRIGDHATQRHEALAAIGDQLEPEADQGQAGGGLDRPANAVPAQKIADPRHDDGIERQPAHRDRAEDQSQ